MKLQNLIHILMGIVCIGLLPNAQAVVPPPDGGYPGGNTAEGQAAFLSLTSGTFNTAVGFSSLRLDSTGNFNTGVGAGTLLSNTADNNTATGAGALLSNTTGAFNTANGAFALFNSTGFNNTATGYNALLNNITGSFNTAVGRFALLNNSTGGGNTALGSGAGDQITTANNVICIGADGADVSNSCYIGNIFGQPVNMGSATAVLVDAGGKLGTTLSSRRFKHDIKPMDNDSEAILLLKPVTFHYKSDATNTPCFGLIAEEVADVKPDLVVRDKEGKPNTVRYDQVNAMLLNEFLKEHRKNEEQEATIARQQKQIDALTAGLQKVSAQLEASKPAPQVVKNP